MPKKITPSQIIGEAGVAIFTNKIRCKNSEHLLKFTSTPQQDDFGIDGFIQKFLNNEHTGRVYAVQPKSTQNFAKTNQGVNIVLDMSALEDEINNYTIPMIIVVVEVSSEDCIWLDVKTNQEILKNYSEAKIQNQKTLTVYLDKRKSLPKSLHLMIRHLHLLEEIHATETIFSASKSKSLSQRIILGNSISEGIRSYPGLSCTINRRPENTLFSVGFGTDLYNYYPENGVKAPHLKIKLKVKDNIKGLEDMMSRETDKYSSKGEFKLVLDDEIIEDGNMSFDFYAHDEFCTIRLIDASDENNSIDLKSSIFKFSEYGKVKLETIDEGFCPFIISLITSGGEIVSDKVEQIDIILNIDVNYDKCSKLGINQVYKYLKRFESLNLIRF